MTIAALTLSPAASGQPAPATVRTRVTVPLRFPDGYSTTAEVFWRPTGGDDARYSGSFTDPDGHAWEIVLLGQEHVIN